MLALIRRTVRSAFNKLGYTISRIEPDLEIPAFDEQAYRDRVADYAANLAHLAVHKAHYGCGVRLLADDWINIDLAKTSPDPEKCYLYVNLTARHPFADNYFDFAFAEDFLEHLDQAESIIFLSESFRTLKPGGVLRLSSPGLIGVFKSHYHSSDYQGAVQLQHEAYTMWEHKHFYMAESLTFVCKQIGFSKIEFVECGISSHEELTNLDYRHHQQDLNVYVELTK